MLVDMFANSPRNGNMLYKIANWELSRTCMVLYVYFHSLGFTEAKAIWGMQLEKNQWFKYIQIYPKIDVQLKCHNNTYYM